MDPKPFQLLSEGLLWSPRRGGDRISTADLKWPKGYSIAHGSTWKEF